MVELGVPLVRRREIRRDVAVSVKSRWYCRDAESVAFRAYVRGLLDGLRDE